MAKKKREWTVTYLVTVTREATVVAESAKQAEQNFNEGELIDGSIIDEFVEEILEIKPARKETT